MGYRGNLTLYVQKRSQSAAGTILPSMRHRRQAPAEHHHLLPTCTGDKSQQATAAQRHPRGDEQSLAAAAPAILHSHPRSERCRYHTPPSVPELEHHHPPAPSHPATQVWFHFPLSLLPTPLLMSSCLCSLLCCRGHGILPGQWVMGFY